jgi:hypothetical protein
MPFPPNPCECAEERSFKRIRASDCLSEASSSSTPLGASTAGCPQRSGGTQAPGSPFFGLPYFGEAKKGESPAAATERHQASAKQPDTSIQTQGFNEPSPNAKKITTLLIP